MPDKFKRIAFATIGALGLSLALAGPAEARDQDGIFQVPLEFVFYYNSGPYGYGSLSDFASDRANLAGYRFLSPGNGRGQLVKNNAGAAANSNQTRHARVFFNSNYKGVYDVVSARWTVNLVKTKNENASFKWMRTPS